LESLSLTDIDSALVLDEYSGISEAHKILQNFIFQRVIIKDKESDQILLMEFSNQLWQASNEYPKNITAIESCYVLLNTAQSLWHCAPVCQKGRKENLISPTPTKKHSSKK